MNVETVDEEDRDERLRALEEAFIENARAASLTNALQKGFVYGASGALMILAGVVSVNCVGVVPTAFAACGLVLTGVGVKAIGHQHQCRQEKRPINSSPFPK